MADCDDVFRPMEVFWTKDDTLDDDVCAYIPGVMNPGNRRPHRSKPKVICKKTKEIKPVKAKIPQPKDSKNSRNKHESNTKNTEEADKTSDDKKVVKATLKDLCADDKKRVANLIKELAKLGEAKESVTDQLQSERQIFERRIQDLIDQQDRIHAEKEGIKRQLAECQKLLTRYQEYLEQCTDTKQPTQQVILDNKNIPQSVPSVELYTPKSLSRSVRQMKKDMVDLHSSPSDQVRSPDDQIEFNNDVLPEPGHQISDKYLFPIYIEPKNATNSENNQFDDDLPDKHNPDVHSKPPSKYYLLKHNADASFTDRPFTKKIDQAIAKEKVNMNSGSELLFDDKIFNLEPTAALSEASIQRNEGDTGINYLPDKSQAFLTRLNEHNMNSKPQRIVLQPTLEPTSCSLPSDSCGFLDGYKNLGPEERRHKLLAQKMALLEEQKRLKAILLEQEQMLHAKQDYLHRQQEIQQRRLKHFENTGTFPPHHTYKHLVHGNKTCVGILADSLHRTQLSPPKKNKPDVFDLSTSHGNDDCYDGIPVLPLPSSGHTTALGSGSHPSATSHDIDGDPFERQVAETHAVIAASQQEFSKKMVSRATSPIHLIHQEGAAQTEPVCEDSEENIFHLLQNETSKPQGTARFKETRTTRIKQKPVYVQTSELIDLVNEVERSVLSQDGSFQIQPTCIAQQPSQINRNYAEDESDSYINEINSYVEDLEAEESQVIEDVFFLK